MTDIVVEITENNTQVTVSAPDVIVVTDVPPAASAAASAAAAAASAEEAADNAPVQSVFGRTGHVTLQGSDVSGALGYSPENPATKGQANGYASLDASGLVPSAQLPSYVDDVVEYANVATFPATGETGKIYVALDTGRTWRWSGSAYAEIVASPGTTDAITEGVSNLFFTNARAVAAIQANNINLGSHTLAAGAATFASLVATGLITAASSSGFAAGNFFAYDSGGIARAGAATGSNLRLYSNGVNAVDFDASGTPTFNAGANVTGALAATGKISTTGAVALASGQKLHFDGVAATGDTYAVESSANVLDIYAGGTKSLSLTTAGAAVTGTFSATGVVGLGAAANSVAGLAVGNSALTGTAQYGVVSEITGSSAATSGVIGVQSQPKTAAAAFTTSAMYGFRALDGVKGAGSTITSQYGVYVEALTSGASNYGIASAVVAGSNRWNLYISGTANNYLGSDTALLATKKLYLDGAAGVGGDTYLVESSANVLDFYAGGVNALRLTIDASAALAKINAGGLAAELSLNSASTGGRDFRLYSSQPAYSGGAGNFGIYNATDTKFMAMFFPNMSGMTGLSLGSNSAITAPSDTSSLLHLGIGGGLAATRTNINYRNGGYAAPSAVNAESTGDKLVFWNDSDDKYAIGIDSPSRLWIQASGNASSHFAVFTSASASAPTERLRITSGGNVGIGATAKLCLDGTAATGNTYLVESSADVLDMYAGGTKTLSLTASGAAVTGTLSATGKATLGASAGGEQIATTSVTTFSGGSGYQSFYSEGTERLRVGWKNAGPDTGIVPAQVMMGGTADLYLASRDNASGRVFINAGSGIPTVGTFSSTGLAVTGTIGTTDPAGGAGPAWKLGVAASVSPTSPNRTLRVDIAGTSYYIAAKTTND